MTSIIIVLTITSEEVALLYQLLKEAKRYNFPFLRVAIINIFSDCYLVRMIEVVRIAKSIE